jgi:hypothetical protein
MNIVYTYITVIIWALVECFTNVLPCCTMKTRLTYLHITFHPIFKKPQTDHESKTLGVPEIRAPPRK